LHRGFITFFSEYLEHRNLSGIAQSGVQVSNTKKASKEQFNVILAENHSIFGRIPALGPFRSAVGQEVF
jgi:hypothetical protein